GSASRRNSRSAVVSAVSATPQTNARGAIRLSLASAATPSPLLLTYQAVGRPGGDQCIADARGLVAGTDRPDAQPIEGTAIAQVRRLAEGLVVAEDAAVAALELFEGVGGFFLGAIGAELGKVGTGRRGCDLFRLRGRRRQRRRLGRRARGRAADVGHRLWRAGLLFDGVEVGRPRCGLLRHRVL